MQCLHDANTNGDWLVLSTSIKFTDECRATDCRKAFISRAQQKIFNVYHNIKLPIKFTNGQTIPVEMSFCSSEQTSIGNGFYYCMIIFIINTIEFRKAL